MTLLLFLMMVLFFIFIIGLCIGSFLNVVILRAFSNESICFPGSKCPICQKPLKWYHNIPVLSYLFLKGKCAFCNDKISIQYPIVELITGLLFVSVFIKYGINLNAIFILIFTSLFIVISVTDIKKRVVFDFHTYFLIIIGLIYNFFNIGNIYIGDKLITLGKFSFGIHNSIIASLLGLLIGVIVMEIFARLGYIIAKTRAFGEGDTYIAAGLGAILGYKYLITALVYAFIIQLILTIPLFLKKLYNKKDYITIASFLGFFLIVLLVKWFNDENFISNMASFSVTAFILCFACYYVCKRILGRLNDKEDMTYLPFGPAMVLGGLITLFLI